jgi:hypothetical protein
MPSTASVRHRVAPDDAGRGYPMMVVAGLFLGGVFLLAVACANLNDYPAPSQEGNDYGEKHRSS